MRSLTQSAPGVCLVLCHLLAASATGNVFVYSGYNDLAAELGGSVPTGAGVRVTLVEANSDPNLLTGDADPSNDHLPVDGAYNFIPKASDPKLSGKTFTVHIPPDTSGADISGHASNVAFAWFGNTTSSIASGVTQIAVFEANHWLGSGQLDFDAPNPPPANPNDSRVANHAYVGTSGDSTIDLHLVQRMDWLVATDDYIQVVGVGSGSPIHAAAFNPIRAGRLRTDGATAGSTPALPGPTYTGGRIIHDVLAIEGTPSIASARVSSVATLLVQVAQDNPSLSNGSLVDRNALTVYHGATAEVVKALILAGADRDLVSATTTTGADYSVNSTNGLHNQYGAGVVNIYNAYHMLAGGEDDSSEDGGPSSVGLYGFDYDDAFGGGGGSNTQATYRFTAAVAIDEFVASLVWNVDVDMAEVIADNEDTAATLQNLNLSLYRVTGGGDVLVGSSTSTVESTENIWLQGLAAGDYKIVVDKVGGSFEWDYGIAWRASLTAVPAPTSLAAAWLLAPIVFRRRLRR